MFCHILKNICVGGKYVSQIPFYAYAVLERERRMRISSKPNTLLGNFFGAEKTLQFIGFFQDHSQVSKELG
jgi:hypothetical protein